MLGTIVNTATIILGTSLGALLKKGVNSVSGRAL
jgi:uncharacterized membrane protein YqgA involved in biofilm formation